MLLVCYPYVTRIYPCGVLAFGSSHKKFDVWLAKCESRSSKTGLNSWIPDTFYPGYQRFFSRAAGIFGVGQRPKPRENLLLFARETKMRE